MNEYGFPYDTASNQVQSVGSSIASFFDVAQTTGYVVAFLLFIALVYFIFMLFELKSKVQEKFDNHFIQAEKKPTKNPRKEHWKKIATTISTSTDQQLWRLAVIDMDIMLEESIDEVFHPIGESFGEKLKSFDRNRAPWIDAVWEVHRLRNILAHEGSRYPLNQREAFRAFKISENVLNEFGYFA